MRHVGRWISGAAGVYAVACGLWPGFARAALDYFALPVMDALNRLTAAAPFPVVEPLAVGGMAVALAGLIRAAVERRGGLLRGAMRMALAPLVALILLWGPALLQPAEGPPAPGAEQLTRLCDDLIAALDAADLDVIDADACLCRAGEVAGMPGRVVKAARYPEWMRLCRCSGLYMPLTGEALVDAKAPAALVPFTAVHELMHLSGVADEGAANVLAWERCIAAGGAFAASARLWALRYAMGLLRQSDAEAWRAATAKLRGATARWFRESGGEIAPAAGTPFTRGDYAALAGYLAAEFVY